MALLISFAYGQNPTVPGRPQPAKQSVQTQPTPKAKPPQKPTPKPNPQTKPAPKPKPVANSNQTKTPTKTPTNNQSTNPIKSEDRSYGQWVDLGLPSGTLWKNTNETNSGDSYGFYTNDEAVRTFGSKLPTKEQLNELRVKCTWTWSSNKNGYNVVGPNGNSIFLPAAGNRGCDGYVNYVGSGGDYWSSTPGGSDNAWVLYFGSGGVYVGYDNRCYGQSVRLVQD